MVTCRPLDVQDLPQLAESLASDTYHKDTPISFFSQEGTISTVYEDETSPILVIRGTKSLRLDIQFMNNRDFERNRKTLEENFQSVMAAAKASGFTEVTFDSKSPLLKRFCKQKFGFNVVDGDVLRKEL